MCIRDRADTAKRLEMPVFPVDKFVDAVTEVVKANEAYVPPYGSGATLYIRCLLYTSGGGIDEANAAKFAVAGNSL